MNVNRKYKSSVFTKLFNDLDRLLSLYNAISGNNLPPGTEVEIATLDDILFTDRHNDIAFILDDKIVILIEHQSSINNNMPLRLLIYVARVYEKLIDNDAVYKRKLLKIPKPDFIVLYNGADPFPDEKTLRLSDAYKEISETLDGLGGFLDLEVRVVNINEGRNEDIVGKCESLNGYVRFVGKVRNNLDAGMDLSVAVTKATGNCIEEGILADFLKEHSSEVINMLTNEWSIERAIFIREQEAHEEGIEKGIDKGVDISTEIMRALVKKIPMEKIAERYQVPIEKIVQFQSALTQYSA